MPRKAPTAPTLITAFNWVYAQIEQRDLTPSQQLALFHLVGKFNKNFWRPTPISLNKLAANMSQDKRTVKKSIDTLKELKLIIETKAGYKLGITDTNSDDDNRHNQQVTATDNGRPNDEGERNVESIESSAGALHYFNEIKI